jgi:hypothetical protein
MAPSSSTSSARQLGSSWNWMAKVTWVKNNQTPRGSSGSKAMG